MFQELKFQLSTAILTILTLAAGVSRIINFEEQNHFRLPEDGVIWVDRSGGVQALHVPAGSPGRQGRHPHGRLADRTSTASRSRTPLDVPKALAGSAPGATRHT